MSRSGPSTTSGPPPPATPAKKSSPEEVAALRQTFNALDTRHRGKIDARALSVLCKEIGIPTDVAPLVAMVFDQDRSGSINFEEFVEYMESVVDLEVNPRRFFLHVFNAIDTNRSGLLDPQELVRFASLLNVTMTESDALRAIDEIDLDGNHEIDFHELCVALGI
jgi:Ca2+-binding EF-hand superfamily protein